MYWSDKTRAALRLAYHLHDGQVDKADVPYIFHPYRVADKMEQYRLHDVERMTVVALLHDSIEDTDLNAAGLQELAQEYGLEIDEPTIIAIDAMTRRSGETYQTFIRRAKRNPDARWVKLEDVKDNLIKERIREPIPDALLERYNKAYNELIK